MNTAERSERAKAGIVHEAKNCEDALRMAAFAADEPSLSIGIAEGLRKMAAFHSENAFRWVGWLSSGGHA
jgi:hypothetical protein